MAKTRAITCGMCKRGARGGYCEKHKNAERARNKKRYAANEAKIPVAILTERERIASLLADSLGADRAKLLEIFSRP